MQRFRQRCLGLVFFLGLTVGPSIPAWAALKIVTSYPQDATLARAIGGDKVTVQSLAKASQNPHTLEPRPSFAIALNRADLLIVNGQDMELAWLPIALINCRNQKILEGQPGYFNPSEGVTLYPYSPEELQMTPYYTLTLIVGDPKRRGNHHYWLDPANVLITAENVTGKLKAMDRENAAFYQANYERFTARLKEKIKTWDAMIAPYKGVPVISFHRDWIYFTKRYGLNLIGYIEPRETIPPSASEVASLVRRMKDEGVKLILTSHWQPQKISQEIARQTGVTLVTLPSTIGEEIGVKDFFDLFEKIYTTMAQALKEVTGK
ncbi:MAG: zinc ABC transporter substrate-binding protein [candidate division NC10 bacterium]|nr:zinc ABC transporter substrate-binding protein [candidate division NC10 bacterium]